jgi:hypothetical protein
MNLISQGVVSIEPIMEEVEQPMLQIDPTFFQYEWYKYVVFYLQNLKCLAKWDKGKAISVRLKEAKYCIIDQQMFWKYLGGILLNFITENQTSNIINEFHSRVCGVHRAWRYTSYKIFRVGYYWPTLFVDTNALVRAFLECQISGGKKKLLPLPLQPIKMEEPFQ